MSIGEPKMPTAEEIAGMNKSRKEYTQELISGGAEIVPDEAGESWKLENVSDEQTARARSEMESDMAQKKSGDEKKAEDISKTIRYGLEGLTGDERRFYESRRGLTKQAIEIERLYQQGKIDDKTRFSLFQPNSRATKELRSTLHVDDDARAKIENAIRQEVKEDYAKEIRDTRTFDELFSVLNFGIQGSQEYYDGKVLQDKIRRVRQGKADADVITSSLGLRQKVEDLLKSEEESKKEFREADEFWSVNLSEARGRLLSEMRAGKSRQVRVMRSSGEMEDGWVLGNINPDGVALVLKDGLEKETLLEDLAKWNR